jgi:hypothetical protein
LKRFGVERDIPGTISPIGGLKPYPLGAVPGTNWGLTLSHLANTLPEQLDQTKLTGNAQVDNLQDGVNNLVAGQVGQGGLGEGVGDQLSGGISESEKNKNQNASGMLGNVGEGLKGAGNSVGQGVSNVGSSVGGVLGGGKK